MMEEIKLYLTLKETEFLVFNRYLLVNKSRLSINKAQGLYSIDIKFEENYLIEKNDNYLILFTAVKVFEIPEKEETLFVNHYKLPLGLIQLTKRNVRDEENSSQTSIEVPAQEESNNPFYLPIRNALIQQFKFAISKKGQEKEFLTVIMNLPKLDTFQSNFIRSLLREGKFPLLKVKTKDFKPEMFFRYTWWGKFIIDHLLESNKDQLEDPQIEDHKRWFKDFSEPTDFSTLNKAISNTPKLYKDVIEFILGYYVAAMNFEKAEIGDFPKVLYTYISNFKLEKPNLLLQWAMFFQAIFRDELVNLFLIPSLRCQAYNLEKLAYQLTLNEMEPIDWNQEIEVIDLKKDDQIGEFVQLKKGGDLISPEVIDERELSDIFCNNLSKRSLRNIGLVLKSSYETNSYFYNTCSFVDNEFQLNLSCRPSDVVFYSSSDSEASEYLRELKIKQKPVKSLFDKKKRVLIGFINERSLGLTKLYAHLLQAETAPKFEKYLFVWLVNRDSEEIQSTEFDAEKKEIEGRLQTIFGTNVILIIKNQNKNSEVEIVRNLNNLLTGYRVDQLEVIDENFDETKAKWILEGSKEYFLKEKAKPNYYTFFNN